MDRLPAATSLARALLALSRAGATGVLEVSAVARSARVAVMDGIPRAAALEPGDDLTLGDLLAREGALDAAAHARALERGAPPGPVGSWLIDTGAATAPAVAWALRRQLERRVGRLFEWTGAEYRFRRGPPEIGTAHVAEPIPTADVVLSAMREAVRGVPVVAARRRLGDGLLVLTRLGETLVKDAALWPEEATMVPHLRAGASVDTVLGATGHSARAIRGLYALRVLSAAAPPRAEGRAYGVLLRKRRQLRRAIGTSDLDLLDLPPSAKPHEVRRALRRLAHVVHPDRFGASEPEAVHDASREVMTALLQAEQRLRS